MATAWTKEIDRRLMHVSVSPQNWGLPPANGDQEKRLHKIGLDYQDLETRCRQSTYHWLMRQYSHQVGAFHGYYSAQTKQFNEPQTANLIAPFQLIAAFDRYQDEHLLDMAKGAANWLNYHLVDDHPMSLVMGGVRDNLVPEQLWTKYTADYAVLNVELYRRLEDPEFLRRAYQSGKFLLQAQNHGFAVKYDYRREDWMRRGWQSFGRNIAAMMSLHGVTGEKQWLDWATGWADYALGLQAENGCFHLINENYYSSDLAADEIRAYLRLYALTEKEAYRDAALRFADWHLEHQQPNGSWLLTVDRFGVPVSPYVGPGDVPNIAIALLLAHRFGQKVDYLAAALRALRYSMSVQATPDSGSPYLDDPNVRWGFWSWDPYFDYTLSSDQSVHHVRGYWFFLDYFVSLPTEIQEQLVSAVGSTPESGSSANTPKPEVARVG